MKKKFLCLFLALVIISAFVVSAFALGSFTIYSLLDFFEDLDPSRYTHFSQQEWYALSLDERRKNFEYVVTTQGGVIDDRYLDEYLSLPASYEMYHSLVNADGFTPNPFNYAQRILMQKALEEAGIADFGLGYYKGSGHSGGSFADETTGDFLEYQQDHPMNNNSGYTVRVTGVNGNYADFVYDKVPDELFPDETGGYNIYFHLDLYYSNGAFYRQHWHYTGGCADLLSETVSNSVFPSPPNSFGFSSPFYFSPDYSINPDGSFRPSSSTGFADGSSYAGSLAQFLGYGITDSNPLPDGDGTPGTIEDKDGDKHDVIILPTGVLIDGEFYAFNPDYSVTYDNDTYNVYPDYSQVNNDYYQEFLETTINNYYTYYNTPGAEFDDTNIIKSLLSIFSSLETFRLNTYSQLQQIIAYITDLPRTISSSAGSIINAIKNLKLNVNNTIKLDTDEDKEQAIMGWIDLIEFVKKKFCVDTLQANIKNIRSVFLGSSVTAKATGELVAEYDLVTIEYDSSGKSIPVVSRVSSVFTPAIYIEILGNQYNLLSNITAFDSSVTTVKSIISGFLLIGFFLAFFRSLPGIIGNVGAIVGFANANDGTDKLESNGFFDYM